MRVFKNVLGTYTIELDDRFEVIPQEVVELLNSLVKLDPDDLREPMTDEDRFIEYRRYYDEVQEILKDIKIDESKT